MLKLTLSSVAIIVACAGCATVKLTPQGAAVPIVTMTPADLASGYREVGVFTCSRGANARNTSTNIVQCQNELRNRAAAAGGEVLMITSQQLGVADCGNCVTLVATAYRKAT